MSELFEIKVGEQIFKAQKLSGYRLLKTIGREDRDVADMYRDLILACVKDPELTKEQVEEELDSEIFLKLGVELLKAHYGDIEGFRELANLSEK